MPMSSPAGGRQSSRQLTACADCAGQSRTGREGRRDPALRETARRALRIAGGEGGTDGQARHFHRCGPFDESAAGGRGTGRANCACDAEHACAGASRRGSLLARAVGEHRRRGRGGANFRRGRLCRASEGGGARCRHRPERERAGSHVYMGDRGARGWRRADGPAARTRTSVGRTDGRRRCENGARKRRAPGGLARSSHQPGRNDDCGWSRRWKRGGLRAAFYFPPWCAWRRSGRGNWERESESESGAESGK